MPERQCHKCKRQTEWGCEASRFVSSEEDPNAAKDADGIWWAWSKPSMLPMTVDDEESWACPRQDIKQRGPVWSKILFYYGFYKKGHLPQAGGLEDQSNKAIALFRIFDNVNAECDGVEVDRSHVGEDRARQLAPIVAERDKHDVRRG
jgi:hypothetical protein